MIKKQFLKVATVSIKLDVGNPLNNAQEIVKMANSSKASITLFSELSLTAYSCDDLFFQSTLRKDVNSAITYILENNKNEGIIVVGSPLELDGSLFNTAIVIKKNEILGVVPKTYLPNYNEFYEKRYFNSLSNTKKTSIVINNKAYPFGHLIFSDHKNNLHFGIEICEDMWASITPSAYHSINGANVILNLSASNETVNKNVDRSICVIDNSRRNVCAYVYASSNSTESSSNLVYCSNNIVAQIGEEILNETSYLAKSIINYADIDLGKINFRRLKSNNLHQSTNINYQIINFSLNESNDFQFESKFNQLPFVPNSYDEFKQIKELLEVALEKRLTHINAKSVIIGVSGGLDSTMALLVAVNTFKKMKKDLKNIIAVSMPGLGTSSRTKNNAKKMINLLGVTYLEKSIVEETLNHFKTIEHDPNTIDLTYENSQARIRTLILMNLANKHQGIVLGTGDLSELALGFCTYNGDHMSMYGINASLPKTTIRYMVSNYAKKDFKEIKEILLDVVSTPISPELIKNQVTEDQIGKYEINDFIMHRYLEAGDSELRISYLLENVFNLSSTEANNYTKNFFDRFFKQQYKRQTLPDGPKVMSVSLSPRGDYRMVSDIKR